MLLQNCIIVEVPELQGFNKADSNRLKQFLGQKTDKYRAPYERREEEHSRHCVFFGTTNDDEFLRDSTRKQKILARRSTERIRQQKTYLNN